MNTKEDKDIIIKLSLCGVCGGIVTASDKHLLDTNTKERNSFMKDVLKYNLSVVEKTLEEYRAQNLEWCDCSN